MDRVQHQSQRHIPMIDDGRPRGIISRREVLMKVVAPDVKYNSHVMEYVSGIPVTLTSSERISRSIELMIAGGVDNIAHLDDEDCATVVLRSLDVIQIPAEAFPEQLLNLPPGPHQTLSKPEGG